MTKGKKKQVLTREEKVAYLFISVPVILFILFTLIPIGEVFYLSLTNYDVIKDPKWVGLKNFKKLFNDEFFWVALKNTVKYTLMYVPTGLLASLLSALFLNTNKKIAELFRTFYYIPVLSSTVATATLWFWILNPQLGLLNKILALFGISGPAWLYDSQWAMVGIVVMSVWAGFGSNMMIFLSGLKGIPTNLYESAQLDGAGKFAIFRYVTLPSLSRTTFFVSTNLIIGAFQVFDQAFVLTRGGPGNATITLVYYIYNNGFKNLKMGYASAITVILFMMIAAMSFINMKINKADDDGGLM